jgi:hypothetical protein
VTSRVTLFVEVMNLEVVSLTVEILFIWTKFEKMEIYERRDPLYQYLAGMSI